jgi:hypothetical protein
VDAALAAEAAADGRRGLHLVVMGHVDAGGPPNTLPVFLFRNVHRQIDPSCGIALRVSYLLYQDMDINVLRWCTGQP